MTAYRGQGSGRLRSPRLLPLFGSLLLFQSSGSAISRHRLAEHCSLPACVPPSTLSAVSHLILVDRAAHPATPSRRSFNMSPDAEDGSPSPGPGLDRDSSSIMAEEKIERASTDERSPARAGVDNKPPPKSNPKDPSRPRRKKARRACFACQRAHLTCGNLCETIQPQKRLLTT